MLLPCPRSPNMSAGSTENKLKQIAKKGDAINYPIKYAEEVHWTKIWGILQLKLGKPVREKNSLNGVPQKRRTRTQQIECHNAEKGSGAIKSVNHFDGHRQSR
jgi:hypothetical protein